MKYILNETPVKTSNNYKINNLEIELNMPIIKSFGKYEISGVDYKEYDYDSFTSKIGLSFNKCHKLDIDIEGNKNINISYIIKEDILVDEIHLNLNSNSISNITIKYESKSSVHHHMKLVIDGKTNSKANINLINMISSNSKSFIAIQSELDEASNIDINFIDLGGDLRASNYYAELKESSISNFNNIYIGSGNDRIDMNYLENINAPKSEGYINVCGCLSFNAYKTFKGTIDFVEGCKKSIGKELENTILLSDSSISRSLPMLLCHEEDVEGSHGVSTGKIDNEKLFYLMTRGMSELEAKKLIIKSNFNEVLNKLDEEIKKEIVNIIDETIN